MVTTGSRVLSGNCFKELYHDIRFEICEMFHKSHFSLIKCSKISSTPYSIHLPYILSNHHFIQPHDPKVVLLRGPNWPFSCFRFFFKIFIVYYICTIFYNILSDYLISSLKIWWVILIWELAALIKLFLYFHDISTIFSIFYPIIRYHL